VYVSRLFHLPLPRPPRRGLTPAKLGVLIPTAVLAALIIVSAVGCSFPPSLNSRISTHEGAAVDASLAPEVERFRAAAKSMTAGQRAEPDDEDLRLFAQALTGIARYHVDPVDPVKLVNTAIATLNTVEPGSVQTSKPLVDGAIAAMVSSIDPHGAYLDREVYRELRGDTKGGPGGVGLELTMRDHAPTIVSPMADSPAVHAGIAPEDQLTAIDGVPTTGLTLVGVVQRLRGPVGTEIALTIRRRDSQATTIHLRREVVEIHPVTFQTMAPGYAYLRITQFAESTSMKVDHALSSLANGGGLKGLVLDLRNNPGGLLNQAVRVADLFLDSGEILRTSARTEQQDQSFFAHPLGTWNGFGLVVLVNRGTAAGSEILAAALQCHKRATILGTPTFANGTVQTIIPIGEDSALRLTTSRAHAPDGRAIGLGIQPDILDDSEPAETVDRSQDPVVGRALELLGYHVTGERLPEAFRPPSTFTAFRPSRRVGGFRTPKIPGFARRW
jgi:carboxyl-terminal processing protease